MFPHNYKSDLFTSLENLHIAGLIRQSKTNTQKFGWWKNMDNTFFNTLQSYSSLRSVASEHLSAMTNG